jgi:hypothetical protein
LSITNGGTVIAHPPLSIFVNVLVEDSGTLAGNGTITMVGGTMQTLVHGTVAPSGGGGTLTLDGGDLQLESNGTTQFTVTPQDTPSTPQITVSGAASLDGLVSVTMKGSFTPNTTYTLLSSNVINGTFFRQSLNYDPKQCFRPVIQYDPQHVYLYLEPTCE